jgi:phosphoglycerate dehydrogenase-like enzyme
MKLLIASPIDPDAIGQLRRKHDVIEAVGADEATLSERIRDREAIIFRSGVSISAGVMSNAPGLKLLIRAGSGLDNLDMDYVTAQGLTLVRIPEPGARAVAELAFAMMLTLARQVLPADRLLRDGHWAKHQIEGHLLRGKTLGIFGCGSIGSQVARMGLAWDMAVVACVKNPTPARVQEMAATGIRLTDAGEVLGSADFLSIHCPLDDSTRDIFDAAAIARIKPGAFLVNLARGGVVVEQALLEALESGNLRGAGTDVHEREGEGQVSPLARLHNVVLTPHMGAGTVDTQREIGQRVIESVDEYGMPTQTGQPATGTPQ